MEFKAADHLELKKAANEIAEDLKFSLNIAPGETALANNREKAELICHLKEKQKCSFKLYYIRSIGSE